MERYEYVDKKYPSLRKYNFFYLVKTLTTAYNDAFTINNISDKLKKRLQTLNNKVKEELQKYGIENF